MNGMGPLDKTSDLLTGRQNEQVLEKMRLRSDDQILLGRVRRGLKLSRAPAEALKLLDLAQKENVMCLQGASLIKKSSLATRELAQLPLYYNRQIDSYYYEDRPAGTLLIEAGETNSLENEIFFKENKILCARSIPSPKSAWVEPPYITDQGIYYIEPGGNDPRYVVALLNSSLIYFWLVYGAKKFKNGLLKLDEDELRETPLKAQDARLGRLLAELSNEAANLKKARRGYLDIWKNYSAYMKTGYKKLSGVIVETSAQRVHDTTSEYWASAIRHLPKMDQKEAFDYLFAKACPEDNLISIFGVRGSSVEALMDMRFSNQKLMLYTYCALNDPYLPKPRTLSDIWETTIPVILPDYSKLTLEIENAVMWDFRNYVSAEKLKPHDFRKFEGKPLSMPKELFKIERQLEKTLASIDLLVFGLYGLSSDQATVVIEALPTYCLQKEEVKRSLSAGPLNVVVERILKNGSVFNDDSESACNHDHDKTNSCDNQS